MGLLDTVMKAGMSAAGSALNKKDASLGNFEVATLTPLDGEDTSPFKFLFNPTTITMKKAIDLVEKPEQGNDQGRLQYKSGKAWDLTLPDVILDTYESKKDVRDEYVKKLESFIYVEKEGHAPPRLNFAWGKFKLDYAFMLTGLTLTYELFLADGTPVRAKASLTLKSYETEKARQDSAGDTTNNSPDHARIYTVRRGDTLALISQQAYDTPNEWRVIAEYNSLDDPMNLNPGSRLLLPPILK